MISKEDAIPVVVGFADGLSDVGLNYIDKATNSENKPVLKKPSTIFNLGVGVLGTVASLKFLHGDSRLMGAVISARHVGSAAGAIIEAKMNKQPILEVAEEGNYNVDVTVEDITPTGGEMDIIPPASGSATTPATPPAPQKAEGVSF